MNKKRWMAALLFLAAAPLALLAQRVTDKLDRGLVAVKTNTGVYCSWRIPAAEYYDTQYNIYRDGVKLNAEPLDVSNYTDPSGTTAGRYAVTAIVRGQEQQPCEAVTPWEHDYLDIPLATVLSKEGHDITSDYRANDVSLADLTGDGKIDFILKRINQADADGLFAESATEFTHFEIYTQAGDRLWWIDTGPNMVSGSQVETNAVAYDWDGDGKAEVLMRCADGTVIHTADGEAITIGDASVNTRNTVSHSANMTYTNTGAEYLIYMEGATGKPYQIGPASHPNYMDYPLTRGSASDWGDGYGHRSSKYFFGAPFLDGRHASIFLARGIYTKHKMAAYDVDPATHKLTQRWQWTSDGLDGKWYGQGYHNYGIADVDWDGRDEIVYGSMVIDDNGKGLSTTGLGHGDAQHCGDFNPFMHGQEIFACNESQPSNNYRDATTSKIYYRLAGGSDDGRCIMGNFTNDVIGAVGVSAHDASSVISAVANKHIDGTTSAGLDENFRIYWNGDLLEETLNGDATEGNCVIHKYGSWDPVYTATGTALCNWTKNTPSAMGDILGDWREELVLRTQDNRHLRVYTTTMPTKWRNYSLWDDMQYRQGMVWEMCGYNQPPHVSYFLGEAEGITVAPPPLTMEGRTEIPQGGSIAAANDGQHVLLAETGDATWTVSEGAAPYILTDNAPSWVQGANNNNRITYTYYTHTLTGGAFTGGMRLVKQGDGTLVLPKVTEAYTGSTDLWAGTLRFDGVMQNSHVWMNRFAELHSDGGQFQKGIEMNYASVLRPGGKNQKGEVTVDTLVMNFGAQVSFDVYGADGSADLLKANALKLNTVNWQNGPEFLTPVFNIVPHLADGEERLKAGRYTLAEVGSIDGNIGGIAVTGLSTQKATLSYADGKVFLDVADQRDPSTVTWTGSESASWDLLTTENFQSADGQKDVFVTGDDIVFDDNAATFDVNIAAPVAPKSITFNNYEHAYTLTGDSIVGSGSITKNGDATVTIGNINTFRGKTVINGGKLAVQTLANNVGQTYGSLGGTSNSIEMNGGTLRVNANTTSQQLLNIKTSEAHVEVPNGVTLTMSRGISGGQGSELWKDGGGTLNLATGNSYRKLVIKQGTVHSTEENGQPTLPDTVVFRGGTLTDNYSDGSNTTSNTNFRVDAGTSGTIYLDGRCNYKGRLVGGGNFSVYATFVRNYLDGNWSAFTGTVTANTVKWGSYDPTFDFRNDYGLPKAMLNVAGIDVRNNGHSFALGNLQGSGSLSGDGTWTVGFRNEDGSFAGQVNSPFVKVGGGSFELTSAQTGIGSVTVKGGRLVFNDASGDTDYFNGKQVVASDSGTLAGRGKVSSIRVNSGGTLTPGNPKTTYPSGSIATTGNVQLLKGSTLNLSFTSTRNSKGSHSYLEVGGSLTMHAVVNVTKPERLADFAVGDSIILWTATRVIGEPEAVNLPALPAGLYWDTTGLANAVGVIRVTDVVPSGIDNVAADTEVPCQVYTVDGKKVADVRASLNNVREAVARKQLGHDTFIVVIAGRTLKMTF